MQKRRLPIPGWRSATFAFAFALLSSTVNAAAQSQSAQLTVKNECTSTVYIQGDEIFATVDAGKTANLTSQLFGGFTGNLDFGVGCDAKGDACTTGGGAFNGSTPYTSVFVDYTGETAPAILYNIDLSAGFNIGVKISTANANCPEIACDNFKTGCPASGPAGSCYGSCCDSFEQCSESLCNGLFGGSGNPKTQLYFDAQCPDATSNTSWNCTNTDLLLTLCPGITTDFTNGQAVLAASSSSSSASHTSATAPSTKTATNGVSSGAHTTSTTSSSSSSSTAKSNTNPSNNTDLATNKPNVGAIAGAIIGVLILLALTLGIWFILRRRKQLRLQRERMATTDVLAEDFTPYSMSSSSAYPVSLSTAAQSQPGSQNSREGLLGAWAGTPPPQVPRKSRMPESAAMRARRRAAEGEKQHEPVHAGSSELSPGSSSAALEAAAGPSRTTNHSSSPSDASRPASGPAQVDGEGVPPVETEEQAQMLQEIDVLRQLVHIQEERIHVLGGGRTGARGSLAQTEAPPEYNDDDP